ncbi:hypothetical protein BCR43DRAFT_484383 [Syncephalastrum racemosum]|uniref:Uncharacterized protein n=1 Tax=Syncephalastrum racemosum TaxID=13706 RepID=A0A1X2HWQ1_SYNRA|nr:hypothetical protein BCR43DRAFT_484383 [Syncephalastrum racemosum]
MFSVWSVVGIPSNSLRAAFTPWIRTWKKMRDNQQEVFLDPHGHLKIFPVIQAFEASASLSL